jgi:hypothetical protein
MVLHRPVELAAFIGHNTLAWHFRAPLVVTIEYTLIDHMPLSLICQLA